MPSLEKLPIQFIEHLIQDTKEIGNPEHERQCADCLGQDPYRVCLRCQFRYCPHFASSIDFQFCTYCMHDVILEDSIISKEVTSKSLSGTKTFTRTMKARHLVFKGEDWMFAQTRILDMSDGDIDTTIEYHRAIMSEMLNEREARKIASNKLKLSKYIKSASGKIPLKGGINADGTIIGTDSVSVTTTKITRTRINATSTNSPKVALIQVVAMLRAQGLSDDEIKSKMMAMIGGA